MSSLERGYNVSITVLRDSFSTHHHVHHLFLRYNMNTALVAYWNKSISYKLYSLMYRVTHGLAPTCLTDLCEPCFNTRLRSASRGDYTLPRLLCWQFMHSLHQLHGTICLHIFVVVLLCRSFQLDLNLTFSVPLSLLLSNSIPHSSHTLFLFMSSFSFLYFYFYIFTFLIRLMLGVQSSGGEAP